MDDLAAQVELGRKLAREGNDQAAIAHFKTLAEKHPENAQVLFELAGAYDHAGFEHDAVPYYRQAIASGLPVKLQPRAALQLGSSLRNVGEHKEAVAVLTEAHRRFPTHRALPAFLALALYSMGNARQAIAVLLRAQLQHPDELAGYARALRYYVDELD